MGRIIVLVDDEEVVHALIQDAARQLLADDYRIVGFFDAESALSFCLEKEDSIAGVFLDGRLIRGRFGWEIALALRQRGWTVPIIYLGCTPLPDEYGPYFSGKCEKIPSSFFRSVRENIGQ